MDTDRAPRPADGSRCTLRPFYRTRSNRKSSSSRPSYRRIFLLALIYAAGIAARVSVKNSALAAPPPVAGQIDPPAVSLGVPAQANIGADIDIAVTFDNNDPENESGYGPFIDVIIPRTGADGAGAGADDGLGTTTLSAAFMGSPVPAQDFHRVTFDAGGTALHPFARNAAGDFLAVTGTPGDELVSVRLPFGSFSADQPPATVHLTVNISNLADLGYPLTVRARGGYEFGFTPLDDWCCGDAAINTLGGFTSASVTPTLLTLAKTYTGPADLTAETATGPNFTRQYEVTVDIAPGQTLTGFTISDYLPDNLAYAALVSATPAGYTIPVGGEPVAGAAHLPPDNDLTVLWASVTGGTGTADASAVFSFFVPRDDAIGTRAVNPGTGVAVSSCNNASTAGTWTPIDTRDIGQPVTVDTPGCEHTLTDRSLAVQKEHVNLTGGVYAPNAIIEYSLSVQVSDFFAFDSIEVTDILSDGQHVDPSFTPTLEAAGNGYALAPAAFRPANYDVDTTNIDPTDGPPGAENPATDGTTILTFRVSDEIDSRGQDGRLIGGCVPGGGSANPVCSAYNDGATTAVIRFHAVIQDDFTDTYPSGDWSVDQGDVLGDIAMVDGRLLDTGTLLPVPGDIEVIDDADETFLIEPGGLSKSIYAVNGSTIFGTPVEIKPGDTVTYRITYTLPTSDEENLEFFDYLPMPVFYAADPDATDYGGTPHDDGPAWMFNRVGQSGGPAVIPAPGDANFGPADTFYDYSGQTMFPAVGIDPVNNMLNFFYGDYDHADSQPSTVDLLFTVTVANEPFADRMYLTNQVHAVEGSTNAGEAYADAIVQLILTEPVIVSTKGVIWTSNPSNVFDPAPPGPAAFRDPSFEPRWAGTISSNGLAGDPVDSDVRDVDAGDTVSFAITIENTGSSINGAFDIQLRDILQPQYQIPGTGLNLQVFYGDGTGPIEYNGLSSSCNATGSNDPCGEDIFAAGIELVDPVGEGVCSAHNPNLGNNVILITYDLIIRTGVTPGDIVNTETVIRYAGEEGGENHVPPTSPLTDDAVVTISGAPEKFIVATSEPHTVFTDMDETAVGEVVRYRIVARIPESTSENFQLRDLLPGGLVFLDDGTAHAAFVSSDPSGITSAGRGIVPAVAGCNLSGTAADATIPDISAPGCALSDGNAGSSNSTAADDDVYGDGTDVYFKLGDLTNRDSDDDGEFIIVEFNALVHNRTSNQNDSGDVWNNSVIAYAGVPDLAQIGSESPPVPLRIVEPLLTLDKTHSAMTGADAGDTVTYTATIANNGSADAFEVDFTDTPPAAFLTLNLASVSVTTSGGVTGVVNLSAGGTVRITAGRMPVGSQVVVSYAVVVSPGVIPGQAIDNDAEVLWTSLPGTGSQTPGSSGAIDGERDGTDGPTGNPNDYDRTDIVPLEIREPLFVKSVMGTSAAHTAGNDLAIGEVATFGLLVTLPEGTIPGLRVVDELPDGLAYIGGSEQIVTQAGAPGMCRGLTADFNGTLPVPTLTLNPPGGGSGADLTFDFGSAAVVDDNIDGNNAFLICFDAVLLNEAGNQASPPPLTNTGSLFIGLDSFTDSEDVAIVEPVLQIVKSVDDPTPAPGQTVTFTVIVDHAPATGAVAFDVEISDSLPPDLTLDLGSITAVAAGGLVNVVNASAGNLMFFSVDEFGPGGILTITYQAQVAASFGSTVYNAALTTWSSLPGLDANERTGIDGPGGPLNDYADTAVVPLTTERDLAKSLVGDSHPAPVTALPDVTIGEILTYQLVLTVPPSSVDTYTVVDTLDSGLAFVDCETITGGPDLTSSTVDLNAAGNCVPGTAAGANPLISNSGGTAAFDFGTIANASALNPESITLRYRVVVLDTVVNVGGVELQNTARMQWSTGTVTRQTPPVRIIEPDLGLEKSVDFPSATPFTVLTYRIRIFHTPASALAAYEAVIRDVLPDRITYVPGSLSFVAGSGVAPTLLDDTAIDPATGRQILRAEWSILGLGQESTIQFQAVLQPINLGASVVNTASAEWTSLPEEVPTPPAIFLSPFNQIYSHERLFDDTNPADDYRVTAVVSVTHPLLPDTGFAPGKITVLPAPPAERPYTALDGLRLYIPRLNRNFSVVGVPMGKDGWDLTWLWDQAGYLEGTAFPGASGNSVITAHVYLPNGLPGPFANLSSLRWGDRLILWSGGQRFAYEVRTNTSVLPTDITPFRHESSPWLTLVTCLGYNPLDDSYRYRQVVRAVLIEIR